jgi:hypothetical protein
MPHLHASIPSGCEPILAHTSQLFNPLQERQGPRYYLQGYLEGLVAYLRSQAAARNIRR